MRRKVLNRIAIITYSSRTYFIFRVMCGYKSFAELVQTGRNGSKFTIGNIITQLELLNKNFYVYMKISLLDNFVLESEVLSDFLYIQGVIERNQRQNCLFCIEKKKVT